jgi:hypothetical protein
MLYGKMLIDLGKIDIFIVRSEYNGFPLVLLKT